MNLQALIQDQLIVHIIEHKVFPQDPQIIIEAILINQDQQIVIIEVQEDN